MNVLVFTPYYAPHKSGLSTYVYELAKALRPLNVTTHIVTYNTESAASYECVEGIHITRLPCFHAVNNTYPIPRVNAEYKQALFALKKMDWSCVVTHTRFFLTSISGMRFARNTHTKHIHIEHGNTHVPHTNLFVRFIAWVYDHTLGRVSLRNAQYTVTVSKAGVPFVTRLGATNVVCIPNFVDTTFFSPQKSSFKKDYSLPVDKPIILYVGRLVKEKGVSDLFLATKDLDVIRVIIGDGPHRAILEQTAPPNTFFLGSRSSKDILSALNAADVFVNPSYAEGLPTSVLEAAAVGVPTIASDVGGTAQILPATALFPSGNISAQKNRIVHILNNPQQAKASARNTQKKVRKEFSVHAQAEQFITLFS